MNFKLLFILFFLISLGIYAQQFTEETINLTNAQDGSVSWGDYDNDGDLDILLTGGVGVSRIYKNNGNGSFTEQTSIPLTGVSNSSAAWGDYNNDGFIDILLTGSTISGYISKIYKNNGNDTFSEQTSVSLPGVDYGAAAWGDYDNDGDLDILLTGDSGTEYISKIYKNNGDNSFTEKTSITLKGVKFSSAAWGDYNNDGDLDILLTGLYQGPGTSPTLPVSLIYKNNGDGTFTEQTSISLTGVYYGSSVWGDYNNDGYLDILLTGWTGSKNVAKIYKNNKDGTFIERTAISLTGVNHSSAAWGDYNNDGNLDILLTGGRGGDGISSIYKNNGNGTFTEQTSISLTGVSNSSVAWGDYDNDGDLDILLAGYSYILGFKTPVSKIYKNNNDKLNTIPTAPGNLSSESNVNSVTLSWNISSDVETPRDGLQYNVVIGTSKDGINTLSPMSDRNTGYRRIVRLGNSQTNNYTIKNLPDGKYYWSVQAIDGTFAGSEFAAEQSFSVFEQFTEQTSISLTGVHNGSVAWGDYDNDGDLDFLLTGDISNINNEGITYLYINNGDGTFNRQTSIALANVYGSSVAWGDYNNDGYIDILLTGIFVSKLYKNNRDGTFTEQKSISLTGVSDGSVAWGDYDNDGYLDILLTGSSGSSALSKIYKNNGDGTFTDQPSIILTGVSHSSVAWGDYNDDGYIDILLTGYSTTGPVSEIYKNSGDGSFTKQTSISLAGVSDGSVAWGDYNNDGNLDIILAGNTDSEKVSKIYKNNGDETFSEQKSISLTGVYDGSVVWGDYNNEGTLDILLTGYTGNDIISKIYKNNGDGNFSEQKSIYLTGMAGSSVAWCDYDNDGDLDILLTGLAINNDIGVPASKIYKNNNIELNTIPAAPTNLNSTVNDSTVILSWDASIDNETPKDGLQYNLVIGSSPDEENILSPMSDRKSGFRRVVRLGNSQTNSWKINNLSKGKYYWSVQAIDGAFAGSEFATEQNFNVALKPETPANLKIDSTNQKQIILSWDDNSENEDGFQIERKLPPDTVWVEIDSIQKNETVYSNSGLTPNTEYCYRIRAFNNAGNSTYSNEACAVTDPEVVISITSPKGNEVWTLNSSQDILWTSENVDSVIIEISRNNGSSWSIIDSSYESTGFYSWMVSGKISRQCKIKITDISNPEIWDTSASTFSITQPTGIEDDLLSRVPKEYKLSQNYPNPFNPTTNIQFTVPKTTDLKINVYTILGEKVLTVAEGKYKPGFYKVEINASGLPSGIYIYRIESDVFTSTKKMIYLK